jgi:hypothetical protein
MKTYKYMPKTKAQDGTKPDAKIIKKQSDKGFCGALDPRGIGP